MERSKTTTTTVHDGEPMPGYDTRGYPTSAVVRRIGHKLCCTFPNGNFTMLEAGEEIIIGQPILDAVARAGMYEGPVPESFYIAYAVVDGGAR